MARNKIIYGNETLIDLSGDTAKESDVAQGKTFHKADGSQATGTATGGGTAITPSNSSPVALTKDSSYVIEDNDGYAIESYEDLTVDSSVKTIQSGELYKSDKTAYVSNCSDLGSNRFDIVSGRKFIGKNGQKWTGSRPSFYLYNQEEVVKYYPDVISTKSKKTLFYFGNGCPVYISRSSNNASINFSALKSDGETESVITICSPGASYIDTFQIDDFHYVTDRLVIIEYSYNTSATARSTKYIRGISIKTDGTLVLGTSITGSVGSSATTTVNSKLIPSLFGDDYSYFRLWSVTTISTGAMAIYAAKSFMIASTGAFTNSQSANIVSISSDVDTECPALSYESISRGGFFYRNASGVDYICLIPSYNDTGNRNLTLDVADSSGELASIGIENHFVLGLSKGGYLVTAKNFPSFKYWRIYIWSLDLTSTSNIMSLVNTMIISYPNKEGIYKIISFVNNIITFRGYDTGCCNRYDIATASNKIMVNNNNFMTKALYVAPPYFYANSDLFNLVGTIS